MWSDVAKEFASVAIWFAAMGLAGDENARVVRASPPFDVHGLKILGEFGSGDRRPIGEFGFAGFGIEDVVGEEFQNLLRW